MKEPYLSQFVERVRDGAGTQDIHDAGCHTGYAVTTPAHEALIEREVKRVDLHRVALCPLLESAVVLRDSRNTGARTALTPPPAPPVDPSRQRDVMAAPPSRTSECNAVS